MSERTGTPPPCKCGCGERVAWDYSRASWYQYVTGHYRRDAPYKHEDWLRAEHLEKKRSPKEIGAECGVTGMTIQRALQRFGIEQLTPADYAMKRMLAGGATCEKCGEPMLRSLFGVCCRNADCAAEYARRHHLKHREDVDAGRCQPYLRARTLPAFVYGIHFPSSGILKIGTSTRNITNLSGARVGMRKRGLPYEDACQIWHRPGHYLEEVYVQASFSFRFPPAFQAHNRLSEWFDTGTTSPEELTRLLEEVFNSMPPVPGWYAEPETIAS